MIYPRLNFDPQAQCPTHPVNPPPFPPYLPHGGGGGGGGGGGRIIDRCIIGCTALWNATIHTFLVYNDGMTVDLPRITLTFRCEVVDNGLKGSIIISIVGGKWE